MMWIMAMQCNIIVRVDVAVTRNARVKFSEYQHS